MKSPEEMEAKLRSMMPSAVKHELQDRVFADIDEFNADEVKLSPASKQNIHSKSLFAWAAAIAIGASIAGLSIFSTGQKSPTLPIANIAPIVVGNTTQPLDSTESIASTVDGGYVASENGNVHRSYRRTVIKQERYRDPNNGWIITVSEPREEQVLMPVSSF